MMRIFAVYADDNDHVYKLFIPGENEEFAREYANGIGEIVMVKDVTDEFNISSYSVQRALTNHGFSEREIDVIVRALSFVGITE